MKIRKIIENDKEDVYELALQENKIMQKFFSFPIYKMSITKKEFEQIFNDFLKGDKFFYGIELNNKIIAIIQGYIKKLPEGQIGYIDNLIVSKKHTKQGLSTKLRNHFFNWLKKKGIGYCQLHVLGDNKEAFQIYSKWEFKVDGFQMTKKI